VQTVAGAEAFERFIVHGRLTPASTLRLLTGEQALDLGLRHAMMAAFRERGSHVPGVHPSFQGRVGHAQALGRRADGQ
jgi:hypothetical protein